VTPTANRPRTPSEAPLVVASNRGPATFEPGPGGKLAPVHAAGGVAPILAEALRDRQATWLCTAMSDGDRKVRSKEIDGIRVRFVTLPADVFEAAYNRISNGVLWFVHHALWDLPHQPVFDDELWKAWRGFVAANRAFATAMTEASGASAAVKIGRGRPVFLCEDYHLALAPAMIREGAAGARIAHFSHTPFADPASLGVLPDQMREELVGGMLGADLIGFHAERWAENFRAAAMMLDGVRAAGPRNVRVGGREVRIAVYPLTPPASMADGAAGDDVARIRAKLEKPPGHAVVLRVDRMELSKNIVRGFLAFEEFLRSDRSNRGRVTHVALLSPTRGEVPGYREYAAACRREAGRINDELGTKNWKPIELRVKDDHAEVLAAYGIYDVLLVNPIVDGLNLVAMEGPLVNERDGVLVLSRHAGAFERLGRAALGVNPFDVTEQATAIATALAMPPSERAARAASLRRAATANPPRDWLDDQLGDLLR
jgi:trehalose 6-phosphate synthase